MFDLEKLETLPVLRLPQTQFSELTGLSTTQIFFNDHFNLIHSSWWSLYFAVALIIIYKFIRARNLSVDSASVQNGQNWQSKYKKLFSLSEIEKSVPLRMMGGAILLGYLINFYFLVSHGEGTVQSVESNVNVCWPFFQNCNDFVFLESYPHSHMQRMVYAVLFFVIVIAGRKLFENNVFIAHLCILALFLWHLYITAVSYSQYMHIGAYTYYILAFSFIFLFCAYKRFFFCMAFIFFYFLSVPTKLSDTWILGAYFSAEVARAPIFSNEFIPVATNLVILLQILLPWFLISSRPRFQKTAFYTFSLFHFYATFIVMYHYSIVAIPAFLILFGKLFEPFSGIPKNLKSLTGWSLIAILCFFQAVPHIISNDRWITLQGGLYGMYMIEANHQCDIKIFDGDNVVQHIQKSKPSYRCDPYRYVTIAQQTFCKGNVGAVYGIEFLHSLNGGPFYKIVDEDNLCKLKYKAFSHNEWIKTRETAPALYRPAKNY